MESSGCYPVEIPACSFHLFRRRIEEMEPSDDIHDAPLFADLPGILYDIAYS
jgi:hypothetical protein